MLVEHRPSPPPHDFTVCGLTVELTWCGAWTRFAVTGEVDIATGPLLASLVERVVQARTTKVVALDLSGIRFFGADGVTALLRVLRLVTEANGQLVLVDPSPVTAAILELTNTAARFDIRHRGDCA